MGGNGDRWGEDDWTSEKEGGEGTTKAKEPAKENKQKTPTANKSGTPPETKSVS